MIISRLRPLSRPPSPAVPNYEQHSRSVSPTRNPLEASKLNGDLNSRMEMEDSILTFHPSFESPPKKQIKIEVASRLSIKKTKENNYYSIPNEFYKKNDRSLTPSPIQMHDDKGNNDNSIRENEKVIKKLINELNSLQADNYKMNLLIERIEKNKKNKFYMAELESENEKLTHFIGLKNHEKDILKNEGFSDNYDYKFQKIEALEQRTVNLANNIAAVKNFKFKFNSLKTLFEKNRQKLEEEIMLNLYLRNHIK